MALVVVYWSQIHNGDSRRHTFVLLVQLQGIKKVSCKPRMDRAIIAGTKYDRGVVVLYPDDLSSFEFQIDGDGSGWGVLRGV